MRWKLLLPALACLASLSANAVSLPSTEMAALQEAQAREQRTILQLEAAQQKQAAQLKVLQQTLAVQLRAAAKLGYTATENSARLLEYHGYLGRSRTALIARIQQAQATRDRLIRQRTQHQATLKKLLLQEMQKAPPLPVAMIHALPGTPVYSIADGKVIFADSLRGFGLMIIISHGNGYMSLYGRNNILYAKIGDKVNKNQLIGMAGSTRTDGGTQRYFELRHNGTPLPPGQNTFILTQSASSTSRKGTSS